MKASETTNIARITKLAGGLDTDARAEVRGRLGAGFTDAELKAATEIEERFLDLTDHGRAYVLAAIEAMDEEPQENEAAPAPTPVEPAPAG